MDTNAEANDRLVESLLAVNQLQFTLPPQLGIATSRKHVVMFPQQASYTGASTIIIDSQTGSTYVDPFNSYFVFKVKLTGNVSMSWGSGSVANLIDRIIVRSRSGKELSRVESFPLWAKYSQLYSKGRDWCQTIGRSQGYANYNIAPTDASYGSALVSDTEYSFILPLSLIPCFAPLNGKLLPPQLMEGLRLEITLATPSIAVTNYGAVALSDVSSQVTPELHYDCFTIADQFARKIIDMSARSGLKLLYEEAFHTLVVANTTTINFDIKKACSKGLRLMLIPRDSAKTAGLGNDSFASNQYSFLTQQINIGSEYIPNQKLTTGTTSESNYEAYYQTMFAHNALSGSTCVSPLEYTGTELKTATARATYNSAMTCFTLNKSNVTGLNGFVINNSRALVVNLTRTNTPAELRVDAFLVHLRSLDVMVSNVSVAD
jgi:hypothetical protein